MFVKQRCSFNRGLSVKHRTLCLPILKNDFCLSQAQNVCQVHVCVITKLTNIVLDKQNFRCLLNSSRGILLLINPHKLRQKTKKKWKILALQTKSRFKQALTMHRRYSSRGRSRSETIAMPIIYTLNTTRLSFNLFYSRKNKVIF